MVVNELLIGDVFGVCSPLRKLLEGRRTLDKNRWINSPNVYQKVEITEQGSQDPKKITKVESSKPRSSNP